MFAIFPGNNILPLLPWQLVQTPSSQVNSNLSDAIICLVLDAWGQNSIHTIWKESNPNDLNNVAIR